MELTLKEAFKRAIQAHKSGNLEQADKLYTAILKVNEFHHDANHNLGVIAVSVNKLEEAIKFFQLAIISKPNIAQYWLSYYQALLSSGYFTEAAALLVQLKHRGFSKQRVVELGEALSSVSNDCKWQKYTFMKVSPEEKELLQKLNEKGDFQKLLMKATKLAQKFPVSDFIYNAVGSANYGLGRFDDALDAYKYAININPAYAEVHNNIGKIYKKKFLLDEAIIAFKKAISIKIDYADPYRNIGNVLHVMNKPSDALEYYHKAILYQPDCAEAFYDLGVTFHSLNKMEDAIKSFGQAINLKPDYQAAAHIRAALLGETTKVAPREYVETLFDAYAKNFDTSLVNNLEYDSPKRILNYLIKISEGKPLGSIIDLGCGTGLLGAELSGHCSNIVGVDVSQKMLESAKEKSVYDKLVHDEIVDYLSTAPLSYDYFISADVFIYLGDLSELFYLIKTRNTAKGRLVFTTEHSDLAGYTLLNSGRYSHSECYIRNLSDTYGYQLSHFSKFNLRKEKDEYLVGGMYALDFEP